MYVETLHGPIEARRVPRDTRHAADVTAVTSRWPVDESEGYVTFRLAT